MSFSIDPPRKRVVITGMGWVTPLGHTLDAVWAAMLAGRSGVAKTTLFDASAFPTQFAAEVKDYDLACDVPQAGRFAAAGRRTHFLLGATAQAWRQAQLDRSEVDLQRVGMYLANGEGALDFEAFTRTCLTAWDAERNAVDCARWAEAALAALDGQRELEQEPAAALHHVAALTGARGPAFNTITACAASTQAIGEALEFLRHGDADVMLAGGASSMIHPFGVTGFNRLTALSTRNESPATASRPFDATRDGFVLGEGSGMIVLETLEHARTRGVPILAELVGYGSTADAYRVTDQHPQSAGAIDAMRRALASARVAPEEVDYVNVHGTSTRENDRRETEALHAVFGPHAPRLPASSIKSMLGHLITAAGVVELIACVLAIRDQVLPPTINLHAADPHCDLDYVPNVARHAKVDVVLSNKLGFGGQNDALVIRRYQESGAHKALLPCKARERRVVVTGVGVVSPLGIGEETFWRNLASGAVGLRAISRFDAGRFPCSIGGEVPPFRVTQYVPTAYRKAAKVMARDIQLAVVASQQAFQSAALPSRADDATGAWTDPRFSCHIGAGLISVDLEELTAAMTGSRRGDQLDLLRWGAGGMEQLTPLWLLKYLPNMLASHLTIIHGLTGASNTITANEASGHLAIGEAFRTIARGDSDRALCGGVESKLNPLGLVRQSLLRRLNTSSPQSPETAAAPFAAESPGSILSEGGALLVLEELEAAQTRGAPILAEVCGFGASQDVAAAAESSPATSSYSSALTAALGEAELDAADIDLLIPCGSGCRDEDCAELSALQTVFGSSLARLPLVLLRPQVGNVLAGNALDVATAVLAIHRAVIPPALNADSPKNTLGLNVEPSARAAQLDKVVCSTPSLSGQNAALVLQRFPA